MEYCTGCRWDFRAFWLVQELLDREPAFDLLMIPSPKAGTFDVKDIDGRSIFVKSKGGDFPDPTIDVAQWISESHVAGEKDEDVRLGNLAQVLETAGNEKLPCVDLSYRPEHRQRALYLGQECLRTFSEEVNSLSLRCSESVDDLQVVVVKAAFNKDQSIVWHQGFPETKVLKQKIRDALVPEKSLGHSDNRSETEVDSTTQDSDDDDMGDEEAEEARQFFGVA